MDRISGLSDELLIKILSSLPTKVAVSTSVLSKQWEFLWMWLPNLEYGSEYYSESEDKRIKCFLDRNLPIHRAPVIESFRLQFRHPHLISEDIKLWVLTVVSRYVREVDISYFTYKDKPDILPSSLYTCKTLVTLKLDGTILVDVPRMVCLPALKTLRLEGVTYFDGDSLQRLLSNCSVLEDLLVEGREGDNMRKFIVIVPSLKRLTLRIVYDYCLDGFVIKTPSLKYLKLEYFDYESDHLLIENMPKLREAYVDVSFSYIERVIGSITSVTRLTICSEEVYGDALVFSQLEHLQLCVCKRDSSNLLGQFLKDSPNLRVLDISVIQGHNTDMFEKMGCWNQPSPVPECLLSSLQILTWSRYFGRPEEREIAVYILKNACRLNKATFLADTEQYHVSNQMMINELTHSSRASSTCELVFFEDHRGNEPEYESE